MKHTPILITAVALLAGACQTGTPDRGQAAAPSQPNILLVMYDDVTFGHWSCYGGDIPTPHLEHLADEGMIYHQAYTTAAACTPSRYSIMTGQYPGRSVHEDFRSGNPETQPYRVAWNTPITESNLTLHEVMNRAGYYTGYVGKFHIGSHGFGRPGDNPQIPPIDPGMDPDTPEADSLLEIYQEVLSERVAALTGADFSGSVQWANPEQQPLEAIRHHNLEYQVYGVKRFFDSLPAEKPFFLTVNSTALHGPNHYASLLTDPVYSAGGRIEALREMMPDRSSVFERLYDLGIPYGDGVEDHVNHYHSGIIYMDDQLGAILDMLKAAGMEENTLVIVTADHNIEPGKSTVYERGVNVPFLVRWPGRVLPATESYDRVQFVDFLPTFAGLGGVDIPADVRVDGESFASDFAAPVLNDNRMLYFEEGYTRGVSDGRFKYIAMRVPQPVLDSLEAGVTNRISHMGSARSLFGSIAMNYHPGYFASDQLYDLENDPYEQRNLAFDPDYSGKLEEMQQALDEVLSTFDHPFPLEANGYMAVPSYTRAAKEARALGTGWIPWWNRELDYPPGQ